MDNTGRPGATGTTDSGAIEELHVLELSTSRGANAVGVLVSISLVLAIMLAAMLISGTPQEVIGWRWTLAVGAFVFALVAYLVNRRRRRRLTIARKAGTARLTIEGTGVELELPVECHGAQMSTRMKNLPWHDIYLQLVDRHGRALLLHEARGAAYGPQEGWFPNDIDRSVNSSTFDVHGVGTLATVRGWVEEQDKP